MCSRALPTLGPHTAFGRSCQRDRRPARPGRDDVGTNALDRGECVHLLEGDHVGRPLLEGRVRRDRGLEGLVN